MSLLISDVGPMQGLSWGYRASWPGPLVQGQSLALPAHPMSDGHRVLHKLRGFQAVCIQELLVHDGGAVTNLEDSFEVLQPDAA